MEDSVFLLAKPSNGFEDPAAVRKLQKAGRDKKQRDLLNEHLCQLETALHADRPKNDKSTILNDTIQLLKELTAEVDKLKTEHAALNEESHEVILPGKPTTSQHFSDFRFFLPQCLHSSSSLSLLLIKTALVTVTLLD